MKDKLLIIGAGGHGKVAIDIAKNYYKTIIIADDFKQGEVLSCKIIGGVEKALQGEKCDFFVALGDNKLREQIFDKFVSCGFTAVSLVHPSAIIAEDVVIGRGSIVMAGAVINPSVSIGIGCIINTCSSVDHDCVIDSFTHLCPSTHFAGGVKVGKYNTFGIGTIVINNITICDDAYFGAGAVVVKDVNLSGTYIGVPAKKK
ncbi:MAG: acetyltransferase [Clostridia bacterium]|nr:acetyltransferase [Clostridia bacterium]